MSAPLSKGQKRYLSQLAGQAFSRHLENARAAGQYTEADGLPRSVAEEQFRHREVAQASGKAGLRCCSQDDYKLVEGHFLELLGLHGAAFNAQVRAATETRRLIEHKITEACREFGFSLAYANKICCAQNHGNGLDAVDEKKLWNIFYTIRNRGLARKKALQSAPQPQTEELAHA